MKVRDLAAWQERCAALTQDGEIGREFLKFVEQWADHAEKLLLLDPGKYSAAGSLNATLAVAETQQGRADFMFLGQMLAVLAEHWHYGDSALMDSLTPVERRLVEDLTLLKVAVEQKKAEETHGTDGKPGD